MKTQKNIWKFSVLLAKQNNCAIINSGDNNQNLNFERKKIYAVRKIP